MSHANGHNLTEMLSALTRSELGRLDAALSSLPEGSMVDMAAAVEAIRTAEPLVPGSDEWRGQIDRGRAYELLLILLNKDEAEAQHALEWSEVDAMVAGGLTHVQAWERIRKRYGDADTSFLPHAASRDASRANRVNLKFG